MSDTQKLLPCPWCGNDLYIRKGVNAYGVCRTEGCFGRRIQIVPFDDPKQVDEYNRRATPPGDKTLREALTRGNGARGRIIGALHEHSPGTIEEGTDLGALAEDIIGSLVADGLIALDRAALPSAPEAPG